MRIVTLVENSCGNENCIAEHGLSIYIETENHKLLLDTGQTDAVVKNAEVLGIDLTAVDTVILSHGHYDHSGGILPFAEENPEALRVFLEEYKASTDFVNANTADAAVLVEQYDIVNAKIAEIAIPYCNIVCIPGEAMQTMLSGYLQILFDQNPASVGGALPEEDFYWLG